MPTKVLFKGARKFDARPDRMDFRDLPYRAPLVSLPDKYPSDTLIDDWLSLYREGQMVLDQGKEGSCTGFGLAAVVNYLRWERANRVAIESKQPPTQIKRISARMLYQNARLYDEWKGDDYEGSSCRGAMKGFHKHGVCSEEPLAQFRKARQARVGTQRMGCQRATNAAWRLLSYRRKVASSICNAQSSRRTRSTSRPTCMTAGIASKRIARG